MRKCFLKIIITVSVLQSVNAILSCELYGATKKRLVCSSSDADLEIGGGLLSIYGDVTSVSLKSCRIKKVDCGAFRGLPALQNLDLSENKLRNVMPCVFDDIPQVKLINLTNNKIVELPNGLFERLNSIEAIYLKGNKLNQILPDVLQRPLKLKSLDLSNNVLVGTNLSSRAFENFKQIEYLDLSRNDMSGASEDMLEELQGLKILHMNRCFLNEFPSFAAKVNLRSLKQLILTTNLISHLNDPTIFVNLDELELLNFDGNSIESISENIFTPLRKLKTIVLRHNNLKEVPEKLFQNMPKLISIDLSYNIIEHIEVSMFRNTPMKNLNLSGNRLTFLPESFYMQLISSGGKLKKFFFSQNPWQCACFRELLAEIKANDVEYNSAKYNGNESVCVADNNFHCNRIR